ncbi:diacylglycerol/lipid kinase family protein [Corynebacterium lubricantis]|uniref:diacylglycerol/lipid kinase family protein n=1 Tax=Corynebacterium lubricantis TaxID=541095 RepID=UPI00036A6C23|nr:diacylglycerol kinase family protein [Corynebacterium lubricantis]
MNTPAPRKTATVVYNPIKVNREELAKLVDKHAHGYDVKWEETTEDDPGYSQAKKGVDAGDDLVIACGGDGTVRLVAEAVSETEASLGIIPAGTGNLLARNLRLDADFEAAVRTAFGEKERTIDLCHAEVTYPDTSKETFPFAVMAGVGIDAQMIANTDDDLKKRIGFFAYGVAILKSLKGGNRIKLTRRLDWGRWRTLRAHSVIVGNCGDLVNNLTLLPDAVPDDGKLDVVIMRPNGIFGWAIIGGRLVWQMSQKLWFTLRGQREKAKSSGDGSDSLRYLQGESIEVSFSHREVFEVDGDEIGEVDAFHVRIAPGVLKVRVP